MFSAETHTEQAFNSVRDAVHTPLYGCDCYAYGLLAAGCVDLVVEADLKPYDYMALVPIVQQAGGVMTDWLVCFKPSTYQSEQNSAASVRHTAIYQDILAFKDGSLYDINRKPFQPCLEKRDL